MKKTTTSSAAATSSAALSMGVSGSRAPTTGIKRATPGAKPTKKLTTSQMLEQENKKMEQKLKVVQDLMNKEKDKRSSQGMRGAPTQQQPQQQDASKMWRSSTQSSNYAKQVLEQHKKALSTGLKPQMPKGPSSQQTRTTAGANQAGNPFLSGIQAPQGNTVAAASNITNAVNQQAEEESKPGMVSASASTEATPSGTTSTTTAAAAGEYGEIVQFLSSIGLDKYKDRFIENGIEDEETILELNDEHLDALTIPLGHKLKMLKRIKMVRQDKGMSVPESRQGQRPTRTGNDEGMNVAAESKPATQADYTELPAPSQVSQGSSTGQQPVKSALKTGTSNTQSVTATPAQTKPPKPTANSSSSQQPGANSLLEGQFDEGISHNSFLDALKAWRGEPSAEEEPKDKAVRFKGDDKAGGKKNFFANLNNDDFNVDCLPEPPTFSEGGIQADVQMSDPKFAPKDSCWQCYKLYPRDTPVTCKISNKRFCKETCLKRYEVDNIMTCMLRSGTRSCKTQFVKSTGIFHLGKYLCAEKCINDDDDIKKFNELEENSAKLEAENAADDLSDEGEIDL